MGSFSKLTYHIVFATRYRRKTIRTELQQRLYEYIGGIIRNQKGHLIEIGGIPDHIHILANLAPNSSLSDFVRDIKSNSAKWMNALPEGKNKFEWQKGYGAFTVSASQIESVGQYIQNQEEHHRVKSFEEEYIEFLQRHGIEFERRFLFEAEN